MYDQVNKCSWNDCNPGSGSMHFRPPGHTTTNDLWSGVYFHWRLMTKHECVKLWRKKPMVQIFSKKKKIPTDRFCVFRIETCMNLYSLCLILTGIIPPTHSPQLTSLLNSILSVGPWCTCEVVLAYPLYHDHSQTIMYQGTPTWIYCVSELKKKVYYIWSYSQCKYFLICEKYTVVMTKLVLCYDVYTVNTTCTY